MKLFISLKSHSFKDMIALIYLLMFFQFQPRGKNVQKLLQRSFCEILVYLLWNRPTYYYVVYDFDQEWEWRVKMSDLSDMSITQDSFSR
jgi:hypothetical protein